MTIVETLRLDSWTGMALQAVICSVILLAVAMVATTLLRTGSAAVRHWIWCLAFAGMLLAPLLSLAIPRWPVAVLPIDEGNKTPAAESRNLPAPKAQLETARPEIVSPKRMQTEHAETATGGTSPVRIESTQQVLSGSQSGDVGQSVIVESVRPLESMARTPQHDRQATRLNPAPALIASSEASPPAEATGDRFAERLRLLVLVWSVGAIITIFPLLRGMIWKRQIARTTRPVVDYSWTALLAECRGSLRIRRTVRLVEIDQEIVPMAWGLREPVILLPASAADWSESRRRMVLLHELAHIRRHDLPLQMFARVVSAIYWFNPLAWYGLHRLCIERERACDDAVIAAGQKASEYATELVSIAHSYPAFGTIAAVTMARTPKLEERIHSLFDQKRSHRAMTRVWGMALACIFGAVVLMIASAQPVPVSAEPAAPVRAPSNRPATTTARPAAGDTSSEALPGTSRHGHYTGPIDTAEVQRRIANLSKPDDTVPYEQQDRNWLAVRRERIIPQLLEGLKSKDAQVANDCFYIVMQSKQHRQKTADVLVQKFSNGEEVPSRGYLEYLEQSANDPRVKKILRQASLEQEKHEPIYRARWAWLAGESARAIEILRPLVALVPEPEPEPAGGRGGDPFSATPSLPVIPGPFYVPPRAEPSRRLPIEPNVVRLLGEIGGPAAVELLVPIAADNVWSAAGEAKLSLAKIDPAKYALTKDQETVLVETRRIGKESQDSINKRIRALAKLNKQEIRPLVMQMLLSKRAKDHALIILGEWKDQEAAQLVLEQINDPPSEYWPRKAVATYLEINSGPEAQQALLRLMHAPLPEGRTHHPELLAGVLTAKIPIEAKLSILRAAPPAEEILYAIPRLVWNEVQRGGSVKDLILPLAEQASDLEALVILLPVDSKQAALDKEKLLAPQIRRAMEMLQITRGITTESHHASATAAGRILTAIVEYQLRDQSPQVSKLMEAHDESIRLSAERAGAKLRIPGAVEKLYAHLDINRTTFDGDRVKTEPDWSARQAARETLEAINPANEAERAAREAAILKYLGTPAEQANLRLLANCGGKKSVAALLAILDGEDLKRAVHVAWVLAQLPDKEAAMKGLRRLALYGWFHQFPSQQALRSRDARREFNFQVVPGQQYSVHGKTNPVEIPDELYERFPLDKAEQQFVVRLYRRCQNPADDEQRYTLHPIPYSSPIPQAKSWDASYLPLLREIAAHDISVRPLNVKGTKVAHFNYRQIAAQMIAQITGKPANYTGLAGEEIDSQAYPQPYQDQNALLAKYWFDRLKETGKRVKLPLPEYIYQPEPSPSSLKEAFGPGILEALSAEAARRPDQIEPLDPTAPRRRREGDSPVPGGDGAPTRGTSDASALPRGAAPGLPLPLGAPGSPPVSTPPVTAPSPIGFSTPVEAAPRSVVVHQQQARPTSRTSPSPNRPTPTASQPAPASVRPVAYPGEFAGSIDTAEVRRRIARLTKVEDTLPNGRQDYNWLAARREQIIPQLLEGLKSDNAVIAERCLYLLQTTDHRKEITEVLLEKANQGVKRLPAGALAYLQQSADDSRIKPIFRQALQEYNEIDPLARGRWTWLAGDSAAAVEILKPLVTVVPEPKPSPTPQPANPFFERGGYAPQGPAAPPPPRYKAELPAVQLLGEIRDRTAIPLLLPLATGTDWHAAVAAKFALAKIDAAKYGLTKDQETFLTQTRQWFKVPEEHTQKDIMALSKLSKHEIRPLVLQLLHSSDPRGAALPILNAWQDKEAAPLILKRIERSPAGSGGHTALAVYLQIDHGPEAKQNTLRLLREQPEGRQDLLQGVAMAKIPVKDKLAILRALPSNPAVAGTIANAVWGVVQEGGSAKEWVLPDAEKTTDLETLVSFLPTRSYRTKFDKEKVLAPQIRRAMQLLMEDSDITATSNHRDFYMVQEVLHAVCEYQLRDLAPQVSQLMASRIPAIRLVSERAAAKLQMPGAIDKVYAQLDAVQINDYGNKTESPDIGTRRGAVAALLEIKPAAEAERAVREDLILGYLGTPAENDVLRVLATCAGEKSLAALLPILNGEDLPRAVHIAWIFAQMPDKDLAMKGLRRLAIYGWFHQNLSCFGPPTVQFEIVPGQSFSEGPVHIPNELNQGFPLDEAEQKFLLRNYHVWRSGADTTGGYTPGFSLGIEVLDASYLPVLGEIAAHDPDFGHTAVDGQAVVHFGARQAAAQAIRRITGRRATYIGLAGEEIDSETYRKQPYKDQEALVEKYRAKLKIDAEKLRPVPKPVSSTGLPTTGPIDVPGPAATGGSAPSGTTPPFPPLGTPTEAPTTFPVSPAPNFSVAPATVPATIPTQSVLKRARSGTLPQSR